MNSSDLIRLMLKHHNRFNSKDLSLGVRCVVDAVAQALKSKQNVELRGFGTFSNRKYSASNHRNPRTGETVQVGVRHLPHFKPSDRLRARVNTRKTGK